MEEFFRNGCRSTQPAIWRSLRGVMESATCCRTTRHRGMATLSRFPITRVNSGNKYIRWVKGVISIDKLSECLVMNFIVSYEIMYCTEFLWYWNVTVVVLWFRVKKQQWNIRTTTATNIAKCLTMIISKILIITISHQSTRVTRITVYLPTTILHYFFAKGAQGAEVGRSRPPWCGEAQGSSMGLA